MFSIRLGRMDEPHPAHIGGQLVDLVKGAIFERKRGLAVLRFSQVKEQELIGGRRCEFVLLDIDSAHPVSFPFELLHQMPTDEAARPTDQCSFQTFSPLRRLHRCHSASPTALSCRIASGRVPNTPSLFCHESFGRLRTGSFGRLRTGHTNCTSFFLRVNSWNLS